MTEEAAPYESRVNADNMFSKLDECVEHVLMQVADGHATVAALIVYKDVQGHITFLATGPGRVVDGGFDDYRFTFTETAPDGCGPRLPS